MSVTFEWGGGEFVVEAMGREADDELVQLIREHEADTLVLLLISPVGTRAHFALMDNDDMMIQIATPEAPPPASVTFTVTKSKAAPLRHNQEAVLGWAQAWRHGFRNPAMAPEGAILTDFNGRFFVAQAGFWLRLQPVGFVPEQDLRDLADVSMAPGLVLTETVRPIKAMVGGKAN